MGPRFIINIQYIYIYCSYNIYAPQRTVILFTKLNQFDYIRRRTSCAPRVVVNKHHIGCIWVPGDLHTIRLTIRIRHHQLQGPVCIAVPGSAVFDGTAGYGIQEFGKLRKSRNFVIQRTRRNRIITRQGRQVFTIDLLNADTRMFPADRTAQIEEWFLIWQRIDQSRQQISTTDILFVVSSHRNIRTRIPRSGGIAIDSPICPSGTAPSISSFSGSSSITGVAGIIISTAGKTAPPNDLHPRYHRYTGRAYHRHRRWHIRLRRYNRRNTAFPGSRRNRFYRQNPNRPSYGSGRRSVG